MDVLTEIHVISPIAVRSLERALSLRIIGQLYAEIFLKMEFATMEQGVDSAIVYLMPML